MEAVRRAARSYLSTPGVKAMIERGVYEAVRIEGCTDAVITEYAGYIEVKIPRSRVAVHDTVLEDVVEIKRIPVTEATVYAGHVYYVGGDLLRQTPLATIKVVAYGDACYQEVMVTADQLLKDIEGDLVEAEREEYRVEARPDFDVA